MECDTCCICLEPLDSDIIKLPCDHLLHTSCKNQWTVSQAKKEKFCPYCRHKYWSEPEPDPLVTRFRPTSSARWRAATNWNRTLRTRIPRMREYRFICFRCYDAFFNRFSDLRHHLDYECSRGYIRRSLI